MRLGVLSAIAAVAAGASGLSHAQNYAVTRAQTLYSQMADNGACEATLPEARVYVASSDFDFLPDPAKGAFLYRVMNCALVLEDSRAAIEAANAADALNASWADWARAALGVDFDDDAMAIDGFFDMADQHPQQIPEMRTSFVFGVLRAAHRVDPTDAKSLLIHNLLAQHNYVPPDNTPDDRLRVDHARLLLTRGDVAIARTRLQTVTDPRIILELRVDRTFDPLRGDAAFDRQLDMMAAANAALARARENAASHPKRLSAVLEVAQQLRALGRVQEALDVLEPTIAAAQGSDASARFDDVADQLNWLLNEKAYALYDLGRITEAHAVFGTSIAVGENGDWSVSQVINFASMLNDEGNGRDALEVVRSVGRASPYGDMWAAAVRACGAELSGNTAVRDEAMAFLRTHESDNVAALSQGLLCVNDLDGAAALYIRRLANPEERGGALIALQRYLPRDSSRIPHRALLLERVATVRDRPDVRAAVEAVGRIEDVPLYATYWGDV